MQWREAVASGKNLLLAGQDGVPSLSDLYENASGGLWVLVGPDGDYPWCDPGGQRKTARIVPEMPDSARRDIANRLRAGDVEVLYVTPERFEQSRFVDFLASMAPRYIVLVAPERLANPEERHGPFADQIRTMRRALPSVPLIGWAASSLSVSGQHSLAAQLGLEWHCVCPADDASSPGVAGPPSARAATRRPAVSHQIRPVEGWEEAAPLFDDAVPLDDVAARLGRSRDWCADALCCYLAQTGRTTPFPWVDQPTYLDVAVVAGKAESNAPDIVLPILGDRAPHWAARIILVTLNNRNVQLDTKS